MRGEREKRKEGRGGRERENVYCRRPRHRQGLPPIFSSLLIFI